VAVPGEDERRPAGDQLPRRLDLLHRAERIRRALHEHGRHADRGEVRGAQILGAPGRMERIGEEEQAGDEIRLLGGEHAGLAPTVGLAAEEHALDAERLDRSHCMSEAGAIEGSRRPGRRARASLLTEGQIAA